MPDSLAVDSTRARALLPRNVARMAPRVAVLKPADVILVKTPGRVYEFFRNMADQEYDHMGMLHTVSWFVSEHLTIHVLIDRSFA